MVAFASCCCSTGVLFVVVPKGFIPDQDTDQIAVITEAAQGTSYDKLVEYQDQVADIIRQRSERRGARLDDRRQRGADARRPEPRPDRRAPEAARASGRSWRTRSSRSCGRSSTSVAGMQVYLQNPPTIRIGGQVSKSLYQFSMQSPDRDAALRGRARRCRRRSPSVPGLEDVTSDLAVTSPQVNVDIDRDKAAALGVTANADRERVLRRVRPALGLDDLRPVNEYKVLLELAPQFQATRALSLCTSRRRRLVAAVLQRRRPAHRRRPGRAARHARARQAAGRPADRQPLRPAAGGDDLVRPRAGRVARRRAHAACARSPTRTLPEGVTGQFQGAAAGVPELARRTSPSCSSSPCWSSTSCSASSTRATSTR